VVNAGSIKNSKWIVFAILLASLIMHFGVLKKDLVGFHVWRQTQTQTTIQNFAEEDFNILNPRKNDRGAGDGIFRMEFPIMQWITAIPVKFFNNDVLVSRLMNLLFSILSVFGMFYLVRRLFRSDFVAIMGASILTFTPVFYYYAVNPMPDNLALAFNIWGFFFFIKWYQEGGQKAFGLMVVMLALSGLTKLPFALAFAVPAVVLIKRFFSAGSKRRLLIPLGFILISGLLPVLAWYLTVIPDWEGNGIVSGIFGMDEEQKRKFWYFLWYNIRTNIPELIIGLLSLPLFLWGIFTSSRLWRKSGELSLAFLILLILNSGLIIFEMNMIETVHDYYFLPFVPILVLISAYGLSRIVELAENKQWLMIPLIILIISMPAYSYFRINQRWDSVGFNKDLLIYKEELRAAVPDSALVCAGNDKSHHIFLYYINKKGWAFEQNWMGAKKLEGLVDQGCEYLYTDSRHVDQNPDVQKVFGTKVATFGEINVFKLRNPTDKNALRKNEN